MITTVEEDLQINLTLQTKILSIHQAQKVYSETVSVLNTPKIKKLLPIPIPTRVLPQIIAVPMGSL